MRNLPHKVTGDDLTADEFNDIPEEEENLITSTGQTLSAGDLHQIAKAVATYAAVGDFYNDSGAANAYVLNPLASFLAPIQYWDGMRVRFRISHTNTGASTVNVNSLGIKAIVKEDGISPLGAGDLPAGEHGELIFHADIDAFEIYSHKYQDQSFSTGDNLWSDASGIRAGWILVNDSTKTAIGNAASLAANSIRANADCEALFKLYWTYDATDCPLDGHARGATADADWTAGYRILIPSKFRRAFAVHDIRDAFRMAQVEGARTHALTDAENGHHTHAPSDPTHSHNYDNRYSSGAIAQSGGAFLVGTNITATSGSSTGISIGYSGSGSPHNNMPPTIYTNLYIKL